MNLDLKHIQAKIVPFIKRLRRYGVVFFIVFFAGIYAFLTLRISTLTSSEPGEDQVLEQLQTVRRPQIDEAAVRKIKQLEAQNIDVRTLFDAARKNPFAE